MEENKSEDRTQFYGLVKEMQKEIKEKILSKHSLIIEHQAKEIEELKKENTLMKNQLTNILKKVLLNKNDYLSASRANRLNNLNNSINYNRSMLINGNNRNSNSSMRPLKSCENYRSATANIASRYKETNNSSINANDNSNINIDNKVNGYLNSLYRHNFKNTNKTGGNFFLNKNQTLLDELFPNKNSSYYVSTEEMENEMGNKNKSGKKRENNSTERRSYKKGNMRNYGTKNNSTGRRFKSKYLDTNSNSTKKRNTLDNTEKNHFNTINNDSIKNKIKRPVIYSKRSPFLVNKF